MLVIDDLLIAWGVSTTARFLFQPVMQQFAQDLAKDLAKDVLKDVLKGIPSQLLQSLGKDDIQIAAGKAVKEFLELVQNDLEDSGLSETEIEEYNQPLKKFLDNKNVKEILGSVFNSLLKQKSKILDTKRLEQIWYELDLLPLPDDFNWRRLGKKYIVKVEEIIRDTDSLSNILDSKNMGMIAEATKETAGIIPEFDLEKYQEAIQECYGNLRLDSLDTSGYAYNELKLWRIFIAQNVREVHEVLPQIHEIPKEHLRRLRESNEIEGEIELQAEELESYKRVYLEKPITSVLDIVNDKQSYKYIVILGDPGSGKSSLLQYLALNWAESPLNNVISQPIPLLIELRTYMRNQNEGHCKNFLEFCHQSPGSLHHLNQHQLHEQLKAGKALVMFDGLDEVFDSAKREDIITDIHRFTNEYPDVQVIVTSRVIGYKPQRLRNAEFRHFMLQDLETEQIQDFIYRWHQLTFNNPIDREIKKERLQRAIDTSSAIQELAGNPLLLTMMAILNRNQELPRDRPELYHQASRVLLHQWDVERALIEDKRLDPKTIDYKDKQAMLRHVAYHMQTSEKGLAGNLISAGHLEKILTGYLKSIEVDKPREIARVMIHQLRTRNFMLCFLGADYYAFVHRTFLEYFCAWDYVLKFEKFKTLTIEELKTEVFGKHWQDESWHEVLLLIAGMIDTRFVGELIDYLMSLDGEEEKFTNIFLAANCLAEVRNRSVIGLTATQLLKQLKDLTQYNLNYDYYFSVNMRGLSFDSKIPTQAVTAVATTWKDDRNTFLWLKQRATDDKHQYVRRAAVQELANGWKHEPDTLPFLKQCATSDDASVRPVALQELAKGWREDADTLTIIKQRATDDKHEYVRGAAVQELAKGWKHEPDTFTIIKQRATDDKHEYVRGAAVQELAKGWKHEPDTLPFLKQCAISDDASVRPVAVQELAKGWKDEPDTLPFLKQCATSDNATVRGAAALELARGWKDEPDTLPFLKQCATSDNATVRGAVVQELARRFKHDPDTLTILKLRATDDEDEYVRGAAVQELAKGWKDDPDTLTILKLRATDDEDEYVRGAAVQELVKGWKNEPGMFDFFYNCAIYDPFEGNSDPFKKNPRGIALEVIIKQYRTHPQTLPLLRDRAKHDPDKKVREFANKKLAELEAPGRE